MKNRELQTLRRLIKESAFEIKRMDPSFDEKGDAITSLSSRNRPSPDEGLRQSQQMAKHYFEMYTNEFVEELEKVMETGKSENEAMFLVAKLMDQKYGEF